MNIKEIQDLIKFVAKSGVNEVEIEQKDFKITIKSEEKSAKEANYSSSSTSCSSSSSRCSTSCSAPVAAPAAPAAPRHQLKTDQINYN